MATVHARSQPDTAAAVAATISGGSSSKNRLRDLNSPTPTTAPSTTVATMSPSTLSRLAPATTKRKRETDDDDDDDISQKETQPRFQVHIQLQPQLHPHRRSTIALHPSQRFSLIVPELLADSLEVEVGGSSSPRTRVADRFQSLAIEAGYFAVSDTPEKEDESDPSKTNALEAGPLRKRLRRDDSGIDGIDGSTINNSNGQRDQMEVIVTKDGRIITDPLRASLTWQDDEITVYDPNDADDDGTGVNGIGFKPPPAVAYDRMLKRRQQMAAYRKREEREARAQRSLLRTRAHQAAAATAAASSPTSTEKVPVEAVTVAAGELSPRTPRSRPGFTVAASLTSSPPTTPSPSPARRVRFLETGPVTIRFTEPDAVPGPPSILSS
ncbi:hypothetical protein SEPCBS57363_003684 [Sporothrix epigloea]|uniref:Uncharacterized protein n=1 Tax=Sporothrix epigloea TaxID=1892477 RepID=A0ABP0DMU0_9PEZI